MALKTHIQIVLSILTAVLLTGCAGKNRLSVERSLLSGVGTYSKPITTTSPAAQQWFDQGLVLLYGFNHDEASLSFQQAAALDPEAAMPWWGVAYAAGMNINDPEMTPERWQIGHAAAQKAVSLLDNESGLERALVGAVAKRYVWPAPAEQRPFDEAYAAAMQTVYEQYGSDPDVASWYAEPDEWWVFNNRMHDVLPIAMAMLEGETAYREGRLDEAWAALRRGIAAEDRLVYDEPPAWMLPVRHSLGALMLEAGEFAEAEKLYREDQERHPGNGWSLLGLSQVLVAQGRAAEGAEYALAAKQAWARVEDRPSSSCLCAPRQP